MNKPNTWAWQQDGWPDFHYNQTGLDALLRRYDDACGQLYGMHEALSESIQLEAQLDVLVSEAISTTAIEGELLTRDSIRQSLKRHLGLSRANTQRDRKAEGVANLLLASRAPLNKHIDEAILFSWHREVLGDGTRLIGRDLIVGAWRDEPMEIVSGNIGFEKVHYAAPPAETIPKEMTIFLEWFNGVSSRKNQETINGPTKAALAHLWFEVIHPFDDGNGRVGRAIADLCLAQDKNRPALLNLSHVLLKHRLDYYDQLEAASKTLNATKWVNWFFERVIEAQEEAKKIVQSVIEKTKFWDRVNNLSLDDKKTKALRTLFESEPDGFEGGMTAKKYINLTGASKPTASRDLAEMAKLNCLISLGGGRSTHYQLALEKYKAN